MAKKPDLSRVKECGGHAYQLLALTGLLKDDKDEDVKMAAAQGLGALGAKAKDATGALRDAKKAVGDPKSKFSKTIDAALKNIQPPREKGKS